MVTATARSSVGNPSPLIRAREFRERSIEIYRDAFASKKHPLTRRHSIAEMFREQPRWVVGDAERQAIDTLFDAEAEDNKLRAIGQRWQDYIEARIAERSAAHPCAREAFRSVVKETGEATHAQLVADQDPTPVNRLRAEKETREAMQAKRHYLNALWHDALHHAADVMRRFAHVGERRWT